MSQTKSARILLAEDVKPQLELYEAYLRQDGYEVSPHCTCQSALAELMEQRPDVLILDMHLPDGNGLEVLREAKELYPDLPMVIITSDTSAEVAIKAMQAGAYDFILKPFPAARLKVTLKNVLQRNILQREVSDWRRSFTQTSFHGFVGQSTAMQAIYRIIEAVANSRASVFIHGESGTGKELAAQALHQASPRRSHNFVALNCGAIPHELLESQIFGHNKGAFTGAVNDHAGAAKRADGGTLLLDEICELPLDLQVKLLRFLQTSEVTPVGSEKTEQLDVRIIAATNRDPLAEVKAGRFREDLYYRLHVVPLELPPLRDREDDILLLSQHFLRRFNTEENRKFAGFAPEVLSKFRAYEWPGNVRQLENLMHQIVVLHDGNMVTAAMLPELMQAASSSAASAQLSAADTSTTTLTQGQIKPLWMVEKETIMAALDATDQDVTKAASLLEVSPSTLYRKLQQWKNHSPEQDQKSS